jgi:hypothetical protein
MPFPTFLLFFSDKIDKKVVRQGCRAGEMWTAQFLERLHVFGVCFLFVSFSIGRDKDVACVQQTALRYRVSSPPEDRYP